MVPFERSMSPVARASFPSKFHFSAALYFMLMPGLPRLCRETVTCEEPLLTVDRQMGLNIVHPDGKVNELDQRWNEIKAWPSTQRQSSTGCSMTLNPTRVFFTVSHLVVKSAQCDTDAK
jgi:hypothetical protein